jgi:hypothetical protein
MKEEQVKKALNVILQKISDMESGLLKDVSLLKKRVDSIEKQLARK